MGRGSKSKKRLAPIRTNQQQSPPQQGLTFVEMLSSDPDRSVGIAVQNETPRRPSPCTSSLYGNCSEVEVEVETSGRGRPANYQHERNGSLHVSWTVQDIQRMAREITDGTIASVHLSLLGYWIRESPEHYEMAKEHIRELSLDQGYNVKRIKNEHLRNLLNDIKDIRPKEARGTLIGKHSPASDVEESNSTPESPYDMLNVTESKALPLAMQKERARTLSGPGSVSPVSSPSKDYPPNTPDRPQPLSVKSRHSEKSVFTPQTPGPAQRSVSLPAVTNQDPIASPRTTLLFEDTASHPLLARSTRLSTVPSNFADPDDVFGIPNETDIRDSSAPSANRASEGHTHVSADRESLWIDASSRASSEYATSLRSVTLGESASARNIMIRSGYAAVNNHYEDDSSRPLIDDEKDCEEDNYFHNDEDSYSNDEGSEGELDDLLASFPIPPMRNPVGNLPMLVSRATLSSTSTALSNSTARITLSDSSAAPVNALLEATRSAPSRSTIRSILAQTRARGEALPVIEWNSISPFERSWREQNEELLVAIYGRQDTWLGSADVAYVDCIEREIKAHPGHWVVECLREEAEVF